MSLNERARALVDRALTQPNEMRIEVQTSSVGARIVDAGVNARGGLQAGLLLARVCTSGLAEIQITSGDVVGRPTPFVEVSSDQPVLACMASQYAGWKIAVEKFFAMGSGPMRACWGKEEVFNDVPGCESSSVAVGVLETGQIPDDAVIDYLTQELKLSASAITLLVAPTASLAGSLQVVARSLETALHKLHELKFDLSKVVSGFGSSPMPPIAKDDLAAIGRTNDAVLYGGRVVIWMDAEDDELVEVGEKLPSSSSSDFGATFAELFKRAGYDFYKMDPMLFSPAEVLLQNVRTGRSHHFGERNSSVLERSFFD